MIASRNFMEVIFMLTKEKIAKKALEYATDGGIIVAIPANIFFRKDTAYRYLRIAKIQLASCQNPVCISIEKTGISITFAEATRINNDHTYLENFVELATNKSHVCDVLCFI